MNLKQVIAITFSYYNPGRSLSDELISVYAKDLEEFDEQLCINAYHQWRKNPKNRSFPLPAHISELINPAQFIDSETKARETAARIVGAVTSFGWNNARAAESYIGHEGWAAVDRLGGWSHICQNLGDTINPTTFQAQLRDLLAGSFQYGTENIEKSIRALPARGAGGLTPIGTVLKLWGGNEGDPA